MKEMGLGLGKRGGEDDRDGIRFSSRKKAGYYLGERLQAETVGKDAVVLGIPRGGVIIAQKVASVLKIPFSVIVTKKLAAPSDPELAIGAIGNSRNSLFLNKDLVKSLGLDERDIEVEMRLKIAEIKRRRHEFLLGKEVDLLGKEVVIVDDGIATGATMIAAVRQARNDGAKKVIVATPVISRGALERLQKEADRVIYLKAPEIFFSVGQFYENFPQVADEEVKKILRYNKESKK